MTDKAVTIYADYDYWFSKDFWTLEQVGVLVIGLDPDVVLDPDLPEKYEKDAPDGEILYQLWRYSEEFWDWQEALFDSTRRFFDFYCSSELDVLTHRTKGDTDNHSQVLVRPMEIIQWCVDEARGFHYRLTEYLERQGFDFCFSENSKILSEFKIFSKQDIWSMPAAARLILGISPEAPNKWLQHSRNYYRHLEGNYTLTKRDEVYHVMEAALQSWKTGKLKFFNVYGNDPEDGYYQEEECGVEIEASVFVDWAVKKGFQPPAQLLEMMGLQEPKTNTRPIGRYSTPYMELMYGAIDALGITGENQPAKQTIIDWLKQKNPNLSGREIEYLATFVRTPDMKKGGFYKGKPE